MPKTKASSSNQPMQILYKGTSTYKKSIFSFESEALQKYINVGIKSMYFRTVIFNFKANLMKTKEI